MPEDPNNNPQELLEAGYIPPNTFGGLAKLWNALDGRQKASALGHLWELKRRVRGPNGDAYGLSEKDFVRTASNVIGEARQTIETLFNSYLQREPNAEDKIADASSQTETDEQAEDPRVADTDIGKRDGGNGMPAHDKDGNNPGADAPVTPSGDGNTMATPKTQRGNGRKRKYPKKPGDETPPVVLTPERMREINRLFREKFGK